MWILFAVLVVLWVLSIDLYLPVAVILALFTAMLAAAAAALSRRRSAA